MGIKLVIFDCDLTLWDHHNVSELRLPLTKVDTETVQDADGIRVRLFPGVQEVLSTLRQQGILISVASWNQPEPVFAIFDLLGLSGYFTRPKVEPHPYKERTIAALFQELAADGVPVRAEEVLYVDDRRLHLPRVREAVGPIHTLRPGVDINDLRDVLTYLNEQQPENESVPYARTTRD